MGLCLSLVGMLVGFDNCPVCGHWLVSGLLASLPFCGVHVFGLMSFFLGFRGGVVRFAFLGSFYWLVVLFLFVGALPFLIINS